VTAPDHCTLDALDTVLCARLIDWAGGGPAVEGAGGVEWLLAHCDDGVVWGRRDGDRWALSGDAHPDVSPPLLPATLQELRLFGQAAELLVWRTEAGPRGRRLADRPDPAGPSATRCVDDTRVLVGDRRQGEPSGPFTVVANASGSRHAVPLPCAPGYFPSTPRWHPLRLHLRHHLAQDRDGPSSTGAVRIVATRLVALDLKEAPS